MRVGLVFLAAALLAGSLVGGAAREAGASQFGPTRALHCDAFFPISHLNTFTSSGSGGVSPGSGDYPCGAFVSITAQPAANWRFSGWTNDCAGQANPCGLVLSHWLGEYVYNAGAIFVRIFQTVTVQRTGNGKITSEPAGIDCGATCAVQFPQGDQIALVATPDAGVQFNGWGGACASAGKNARCNLTVAAGVTVTASFGPPPVRLTVTTAGKGKVTTSPPGIDCGSVCSALFASGTRVTLTASPEPEHPFGGWTGACTGTATTCALTLSAETSVGARFAAGKVDGLAGVFSGSWSKSLYRGSLRISGIATAPAQLKATVTGGSRAAGTIERSFDFSVEAGAFNQSFDLPKTGFYPGAYTIRLTGASGGVGIVPRAAALKMEAPKEGVVSRAWVTLGKGKPVTRAPRGTKRLVGYFVYAAKPYVGSKVTVSWYLRGRALGTVKKIRWKPTVVSAVRSSAGLPAGRYTCELRARGKLVYQLSIRLG